MVYEKSTMTSLMSLAKKMPPCLILKCARYHILDPRPSLSGHAQKRRGVEIARYRNLVPRARAFSWPLGTTLALAAKLCAVRMHRIVTEPLKKRVAKKKIPEKLRSKYF